MLSAVRSPLCLPVRKERSDGLVLLRGQGLPARLSEMPEERQEVMGLRETLTLKETLEAATPGPWDTYAVGSEGFGVFGQRGDRRHRITLIGHGAWEDDKADALLIALTPELAAEVLELRERHREAMALALDMGELLDDVIRGSAYGSKRKAALLARLDQIGKEQTP